MSARSPLIPLFVLSLLATPAAARAPVAVTIDEVPWVGGLGPGDTAHKGTARILSALLKHKVQATAFVVCGRVGKSAPILRQWLSAGMPLGNHTWTHRDRSKLSDAEWQRDVTRCKALLEKVTGGPVPLFRYPFLHRGRTLKKRDDGLAILKGVGHQPAPVTIDTGEWALVKPYLKALRAGDKARAAMIGQTYVDHIMAATRRYRRLAVEEAGAGVPHILLLHANAVAADHLDALLTALSADGHTFTPLQTALKHPLYAKPDRYAGGIGLSWLYRIGDQNAGKRWAWDSGQLTALRRRVGDLADRVPYRIGRDLMVTPLTPRVHVVVHEEPYPANSLVAELSDGALLLVDTPYTPAATRRLLGWLRTRFGERPLVAINTHFHPDALGGNTALHAAGARTLGSTDTVRLLAERGPAVRAQMVHWLRKRPDQQKLFADLKHQPPRETFAPAKGLRLKHGRDRVHVVFPGAAHSPDNVVVHLPNHDVLFGGCMVLGHNKIGNKTDADIKSWVGAAAALRPLKAAVVIPGHGKRFDRGLIEHTFKLVKAAAEK